VDRIRCGFRRGDLPKSARGFFYDANPESVAPQFCPLVPGVLMRDFERLKCVIGLELEFFRESCVVARKLQHKSVHTADPSGQVGGMARTTDTISHRRISSPIGVHFALGLTRLCTLSHQQVAQFAPLHCAGRQNSGNLDRRPGQRRGVWTPDASPRAYLRRSIG